MPLTSKEPIDLGQCPIVVTDEHTARQAGYWVLRQFRSQFTMRETMEHLRILASDEPYESEAQLIEALRLWLDIYADRNNWQVERHGEPPNYLRKGMHLNFYPNNIVDGWRFADEALDAIARYYASPARDKRTEDANRVRQKLTASLPVEALEVIVVGPRRRTWGEWVSDWYYYITDKLFTF